MKTIISAKVDECDEEILLCKRVKLQIPHNLDKAEVKVKVKEEDAKEETRIAVKAAVDVVTLKEEEWVEEDSLKKVLHVKGNSLYM